MLISTPLVLQFWDDYVSFIYIYVRIYIHIFHRFPLWHMLRYFLSDICSDILRDILSHIISPHLNIYFDIWSGILSGILSLILYGIYGGFWKWGMPNHRYPRFYHIHIMINIRIKSPIIAHPSKFENSISMHIYQSFETRINNQ